ncbi:helix-turn-helix transcriptional regulator [Pandoraea pnomenusa]|uniref:helix-turn-helix transcriptional regulator n=1 Tax=Pandoraea pnomenusa TaxID=93220 RepID=UPI003CF149FE
MKTDLGLEQYIRPSQLIKERFVPFSAPTLWRKIKSGNFPAPTKINGITAWPLSVIRAWQQTVAVGGTEQEAA